MAAEIGTGTASLTTSIQNYQTLSKDLSDGLQEIAQTNNYIINYPNSTILLTILITIQNQLDSLVSIVLQN